MLSKLTRGNQVTIPKPIIDRIGLKAGRDYLEIVYMHGTIYLKPVDIEERIPKEAWEAFKKKALKQEKGDITVNVKEAENFLARRARLKKNS